MDDWPLGERVPCATALRRHPVAVLPTPVVSAADIAAEVGGADLWIKRDDLTHPLYGGNKVRKLELILADATRRNRDTLLTVGGIGTNHGLATAIHGAAAGFRVHLVLFEQPNSEHVRRSLRLYHHFGARMTLAESYVSTAFQVALRKVTSAARIAGERIYVAGPGGSSPLGTVGFVNAALELEAQVRAGLCPEPAVILCALGSCGTHAGLVAGIRLSGLRSRVIGVRVTPRAVANPLLVARLANRTLALLKRRGGAMDVPSVRAADVEVLDTWYGGEYGLATPASIDAVALAARHGVALETTYTGKAFAAAIELVRVEREGPVLFWNTYNSNDLSKEAGAVDPGDLPRDFHRFFAASETSETT
jgi:1-aminocyclopropane-1-carboxylate deaminase/D-cysteine desulfhydrase-like pyridoxal-dependent ACC family enzyme